MARLDDPRLRLLDLLLTQYRNSPNYIQYMMILTKQMGELHQAFRDVILERYYDNAEGFQLDIIGELVGCSRTLEGVAVAGYFGYDGVDEALGMGDTLDPQAIGGVLFDANQSDTVSDVVLDDAAFRDWIDGRILKNSTPCNVEDTIAFFKTILGDEDLDVQVIENVNRDDIGTFYPAYVEIDLGDGFPVDRIAFIEATAQHIKPTGVTFRVFDNNIEIDTNPIPLPDI